MMAFDTKHLNPDQLTERARAVYEADAFSMRHPEFFGSRANKQVMLDYLTEKGLRWTADNLDKAFAKLQEQGKIQSPDEGFAQMTAGEIAQMASQHGEPQFDDFGRFTGYKWPDRFVKPPAGQMTRAQRAGRTTKSIRPVVPSHPEDFKQKPSRQEWTHWDAGRCREYLEHVGLWGQSFPSDFFRD
jgi:hypothetical protein